jgi:hypothetical protein
MTIKPGDIRRAKPNEHAKSPRMIVILDVKVSKFKPDSDLIATVIVDGKVFSVLEKTLCSLSIHVCGLDEYDK